MSEKLRRRAEERLVETGEKGPSPPTHADDQELIHDLQVHQIELELQNEELLRTQASLEAAKEEFASLYNLAPVGHLSLDSVGVIRRHNVTFAELLGRAGEELIGRRLADFMTAESGQSLLSRFRAFFRSPEGKQIDAVFEDGAGGERILQLSGRRLPGVEEERPLLVVAVDVTEQRAAEKQVKELLEQKDLFLRELRHRTKNNYQTILSILSLGASAARGAETVEALQKVQSRIRTMLLAQEVLSETGADRNVYTRAYLEDLLHRLMELLDPEGRVTLTTEIDDFSIDAGAADALGLVVNEAVTNAFKYAFRDREEGVLTVRLKEHSDRWVLSLRDDGPGVPADQLAPGLGLNLVQALAEQLRGTSRFSGTGNGSCLELIVRRSP
ncbi:MAG: sensor histidine kinase [Spirochaetaceae bacterium]